LAIPLPLLLPRRGTPPTVVCAHARAHVDRTAHAR
jgi:hypothetical protein